MADNPTTDRQGIVPHDDQRSVTRSPRLAFTNVQPDATAHEDREASNTSSIPDHAVDTSIPSPEHDRAHTEAVNSDTRPSIFKDISNENLARIKSILQLDQLDNLPQRKHSLRLSLELIVSKFLYEIHILLQQRPMRLSLAKSLIQQAHAVAYHLEENLTEKSLTARCIVWIGVLEVENADMVAAFRAFITARHVVDPNYVESHLLSLCCRKYLPDLMTHVELSDEYDGNREQIKEDISTIANRAIDAATNDISNPFFIHSDATVNDLGRSQLFGPYGNSVLSLNNSRTSFLNASSPARSVGGARNRANQHSRAEDPDGFQGIDEFLEEILDPTRPRHRARPDRREGNHDGHGASVGADILHTPETTTQTPDMAFAASQIGSANSVPPLQSPTATRTADERRGIEGEQGDDNETVVSSDRVSMTSELSELYRSLQNQLRFGASYGEEDPTVQQTDSLPPSQDNDGQPRIGESLEGVIGGSQSGSDQSSHLAVAYLIPVEGMIQNEQPAQDLNAEAETQERLTGHGITDSSMEPSSVNMTFDGETPSIASEEDEIEPQGTGSEIQSTGEDTMNLRNGSTHIDVTDSTSSIISRDNNSHVQLPSNRSYSSSQRTPSALLLDVNNELTATKGDLTDALAPGQIEHRVRTTTGRRVSLSIETRLPSIPIHVRSATFSGAGDFRSALGRRRSTEPAVHSPLRATSLPGDALDGSS